MLAERLDDQPTIAAERIVLRPLRSSDQGLIALYAGDIRVARGSRNIPHPLPPGMVEAMIARAQAPGRTEDLWAIDGSVSDMPEVMGVAGLARMDRGQSELTLWMAPAFWQAGYAREAAAALVAANPHGAATIFAEVFQDEPGIARSLTGLGFVYLGDAEAFSVARAATVPTWTYMCKTKK